MYCRTWVSSSAVRGGPSYVSWHCGRGSQAVECSADGQGSTSRSPFRFAQRVPAATDNSAPEARWACGRHTSGPVRSLPLPPRLINPAGARTGMRRLRSRASLIDARSMVARDAERRTGRRVGDEPHPVATVDGIPIRCSVTLERSSRSGHDAELTPLAAADARRCRPTGPAHRVLASHAIAASRAPRLRPEPMRPARSVGCGGERALSSAASMSSRGLCSRRCRVTVPLLLLATREDQ
jgi:hypothetical protein